MEKIWWNSYTCNSQNETWENVERNFIQSFPLNRRNFRSEISHSASVPSYVTSLEEMPSSQMFETNQVTGCQNVTVLWPSGQTQSLSVRCISPSDNPKIQEENLIHTLWVFPVLRGMLKFWNSSEKKSSFNFLCHWCDIPTNTWLRDRTRSVLRTKALSFISTISQI